MHLKVMKCIRDDFISPLIERKECRWDMVVVTSRGLLAPRAAKIDQLSGHNSDQSQAVPQLRKRLAIFSASSLTARVSNSLVSGLFSLPPDCLSKCVLHFPLCWPWQFVFPVRTDNKGETRLTIHFQYARHTSDTTGLPSLIRSSL